MNKPIAMTKPEISRLKTPVRPMGLRETILQTEDRGVVEDCVLAAALCTHMSRKTRNGIRNAAAKRRKELSEADGHAGRAAK